MIGMAVFVLAPRKRVNLLFAAGRIKAVQESSAHSGLPSWEHIELCRTVGFLQNFSPLRIIVHGK